MDLKFAVLIALPVLVSNKSHAGEDKRPNIVCIVSEDNSKQYMDIFNKLHGVPTPCIRALANNGIIFENAFSNAPVSSAARSTLISGCWGHRLACQYHRGAVMADMPEGMKMFPAYLREAGYYTVNNAKEDYNINKGDDVWDESSFKGSWRNRANNQPFYYVHNLADTHEGVLLKSPEYIADYIKDYSEVKPFVQPNIPNTQLARDNYVYYCMKIQEMDAKVGSLIAKLADDKLLDDTIIFYYGDNGGILPSSKGYLSEMGLNVPMIVYVPNKFKHLINGATTGRDQRFVSFVDLAPTILELAGIEPPQGMDGKSFWAKGADKNNTAWGYADRMGEKYDMVRSLREGNMKYVRNFTPFNFDGLTNAYRFEIAAYQEWRKLFDEGKLNDLQASFFLPKAPEAMYDISKDPYETRNLANDPKYKAQLLAMRNKMIKWQKDNHDLGIYPEYILAKRAYPNTEKFGIENKKDINRYIDIANLQLKEFDKVKGELAKVLISKDEVDRYWGLIVCSSFGEKAKYLLPQIEKISKEDLSLENRVRAAEYMALIGHEQPQEVMLSALYSCEDPLEATLILNSIAMLQQSKEPFIFNIEVDKLNPEVAKYPLVKSRL